MKLPKRRTPRPRPTIRPECRTANTGLMMESIFGCVHTPRPEQHPSSIPSLTIGDLVWAKVGTTPFWPAQVVDPSLIPSRKRPFLPPKDTASVLVQFFAKYDCAYITPGPQLLPFAPHLISKCARSKSRLFKIAVEEALAAGRKGQPSSPADNISLQNSQGIPLPNAEVKLRFRHTRLPSSSADVCARTVQQRDAQPVRMLTPPPRSTLSFKYDNHGMLPINDCLTPPSPPKPIHRFCGLDELSRQAVLEIERMKQQSALVNIQLKRKSSLDNSGDFCLHKFAMLASSSN
ncbi:uncharacterized protein SPPG_01485 [Spizellomyces punctatus DAOM BR117]|uniref:PWWP domain-containing protein n=1 Tax=Spizellomyces punctatus (strain DAOM BR117) TaxID=645134 RepID=A0A0L0HT38_SPIPD|nr:uncharacterized protein SPPG_01485 [Spizellomyces punctatus DAOM BR117]KND04039.1 hypothetical protein SPPG_01485 [Spizellomyces punctatus DAOM BR117]|eukprot:XP_016612078.1 hypothetical protein SPPG_01485 [Spizellomyces punctatus DAOM BR117]